MHKNNRVPTIVDRSAHRCLRICRGYKILRWRKVYANRAYRRLMNERIHEIEFGFVDFDDYDDSPPYACKCTGRDIC